MIKSSTGVILFLAYLAMSLAAPAFALTKAKTCEQILSSAHELELKPSSAMLDDFLTTTDGTLRPLARDFGLPEIVMGHIRETQPNLKNPLDYLWKDLPSDLKRETIKHVGKKDPVPYHERRNIPGLKVSADMKMTFAIPTRFFGVDYPAGIFSVPIGDYFEPKVEFTNSEKSVGLFEVHFRSNVSPVESDENIRTLERRLDPKPRPPGQEQFYFAGVHLYVLNQLPYTKLQADPFIEAGLRGDHFRRTNLAFEFLSLLMGDGVLKPVEDGDDVFWDHLSADGLSGVTNYFADEGKGLKPKIGDDYKLGYVGFRGSDKFDQPGLYGYEFRYMPYPFMELKVASALAPQWAAKIQVGMLTDAHLLERAKFEAWVQRHRKFRQSAGGLLASTWYDSPWADLLGRLPESYQTLLGYGAFVSKAAKENIIAFLEKATEEETQYGLPRRGGDQLKMVFHRWDQDPLVEGDHAWEALILKSQERAIQRLKANPEKAKEIVVQFLMESEIAKRFLKSLGIEL